MTKEEALKLALEALEKNNNDWKRLADSGDTGRWTAEETELYKQTEQAITAIKKSLEQPEKPKYRRGNRLICLETEEYCVVHISGTDRQWVKFPDSHIGVYTNEQVAELFELLPKEPEQEPVAYGTWDTMIGCGGRMMYVRLDKGQDGCTVPLYTTPPQRTWVGLTDEEILDVNISTVTKVIDEPIVCDTDHNIIQLAKAIEAKIKEKNT